MSETARVFMVYDGGDLVSIHSSLAGAGAAKDAYVQQSVRDAEPDDVEHIRDYLQRFVVVQDAPLRP